MRFLLAVFVLAVVVIASCAAQPQGQARAEAAAASFDRAAPAEGMFPSDRRKFQAQNDVQRPRKWLVRGWEKLLTALA